MFSSWKFLVYISMLLLCAGWSAGADLESGKHAYEAKDFAAAFNEFTPLAGQGKADAQLLLGKSYMEGNRELPRDPVQGEMWLRLAAKDNLPFYQGELATAERDMSQNQIVEGTALAAAWKPKPGLKPDEKPGSAEKPKLQ